MRNCQLTYERIGLPLLLSEYALPFILRDMSVQHYAKSILQCLFSIESIAIHGNDVTVYSLSYDSREVQTGAAFFALPGVHTDGSRFIDAAIAKGAVAVIHEKPLPLYQTHICYIQVPDVRAAMAAAAAAFFDEPSKELITIGVTGTEGKTSTVDFIWQLLRLAGKKAGFSSTVSFSLGDEPVANPAHQTTPESVTVQERLARMRDNGCEYAVVEASSHGLSPRTARLLHVQFDTGIFMNVTQEHLEFHGTFEQYRYDKANLFRALDTHDHKKKNGTVASFGIVNLEDPSAAYFAQATKQPVFGFSLRKSAFDVTAPFPNFAGGLYADGVREEKNGLTFTIHAVYDGMQKSFDTAVPVTGFFNVYNILAALIAVHNLIGLPFDALVPLLNRLAPVKGRMCRVEAGQDFEVLIDYAHTPSSFQLIMPPVRERIKAKGGRVIAVFGSGGERDTVKRPEQGRIAGEYCDIIILTDEDPRGEDPVELLEMIAAGCPDKKRGEELFIIPDRPTALRKAFLLAQKNDAVLLLGKGHENSIIGKNGAVPYNEYTEVQNALHNLQYFFDK